MYKEDIKWFHTTVNCITLRCTLVNIWWFFFSLWIAIFSSLGHWFLSQLFLFCVQSLKVNQHDATKTSLYFQIVSLQRFRRLNVFPNFLIFMWSQRIHVEFARPHVFGFTPDSLRIDKISYRALVRPGLIQNRRGRHCFPTRLSCFCRPFCPVDNVKSLQMSSRLLA